MTTELETKIKSLIPHLEGWCSVEKSLEMAQLILDTRPHIIVELGVFGARSLLPMAMAVREAGQGVVYGIDPWQVEPAIEGEAEANAQWWLKDCPLNVIHEGCMKAIWNEKLDPYVVVMRCRAEHAAHLFMRDRPIDILHFDQNHSEFASMRDIQLYYPLVKPGGYIWFDDTDWATTHAALNLLSEQANTVKDVGTCRLFRKETQHELDQKIIFQA